MLTVQYVEELGAQGDTETILRSKTETLEQTSIFIEVCERMPIAENVWAVSKLPIRWITEIGSIDKQARGVRGIDQVQLLERVFEASVASYVRPNTTPAGIVVLRAYSADRRTGLVVDDSSSEPPASEQVLPART